MGAFCVVVMQPLVQIALQLFNALIQVLAECDLIKFLQDGLVEPLAYAVCLWMFDLGFGVVNIIDRHKQLVIMLVRPATEFSASVSQDA